METKKREEELLTCAKELIEQYCLEELKESADFEDLSKIGVAFTTLEDEEIPIQVNVDLLHFRVDRYLFGDLLYERRQYDSLRELISKELVLMTFDDLVYMPGESRQFYKAFSKFTKRRATNN